MQRTFVWDVLDVGFALTVTRVAVLDAEQTKPPDVIKAVAVYEADVETVLETPDPRLDTPLLQKNTEPRVPDAVKTTLPPVQKVVAVAALIVGVAGCAITRTVLAALVAEQPKEFVTVTVYEADVEAVIEADVAPLLQRYDVPKLEVKTTLSPEQKVNGSSS